MNKMTPLARLAGFLAISVLATASFGLTVRNPAISVEQMTKDADEIVIGNVLSEEPTVIGRTFETRYKIVVHENLKATSGEAVPGKVMTVTLPGAALTTPPMTQYVSGVPYFAEGEEVLLFLRNGKQVDPQKSAAAARNGQRVSGLSASPKIIGWNQGRFSVLENPSTGEKMVARINLENYGLMNSSKDMREILNAIEAKQVPLIEKQVARSADMARESREKDPLSLTSGDIKQLRIDEAAQKGAAMKAIRERGGIAAQYLDDFKAQIQTYVNESN